MSKTAPKREKIVQSLEKVITPKAESLQIEQQIVEKKEIQEIKVEQVKTGEIKVLRILQRLPSGYRLLLETGEIVKISKDRYTKGQPTVIL